MRCVVLAIAFVFASAPVFAQKIEMTFDLSVLGKGTVVAKPIDVDMDGNPHTQEWFLRGTNISSNGGSLGYVFAVAVQRGANVCIGDWFPSPVGPFAAADVVKYFGAPKLLVPPPPFSLSQEWTIVGLEFPKRCARR